MQTESLIGRTQDELKEACTSLGMPGYAASQIARWLYVSRVRSIDEMTNISKAFRDKLSDKFRVGRVKSSVSVSSVDGTRKYLFPVDVESGMLEDSPASRQCRLSGIEAVMIPDKDRKTLCVSSQAGCKMGCRFCMTGRQGYNGSLSAAGIINQFLEVEESTQLTNAVFMGMGEPLDNWENVSKAIAVLSSDWGFGWSPKRITLSTIGIAPALRKFLDGTSCNLAVSLHSPYPEQRLELMPVEREHPLEETLELIRRYDFSGQRRVSFEYTMFAGVNDSTHHADELCRMLRGLECRVNLIRFHKIPDSELEPSSAAAMEKFEARLLNSGIMTTIRASRGEDILAACGMLGGKKK